MRVSGGGWLRTTSTTSSRKNCLAARQEYRARRRELHQLRKARTTSELPRAEHNSPDETVISELDKALS